MLATVLIPLLARRSKKLFFDVVCEALLFEQMQKKGVLGHAQEKTRALFVIDLVNPSWGMFAWLGGLDIAPSQHEEAISFSFGHKALILEAGVIEEVPPDLNTVLVPYHLPPDILTFKPLLLNQGDRVRFRVVVDHPEAKPHPEWLGRNSILLARSGHFVVNAKGRIFGVRKIERKRGSQELVAYASLLFGIALLPMLAQSAVGLIVWLVAGDPRLFLTAPTPLVAPLNALTRAQQFSC